MRDDAHEVNVYLDPDGAPHDRLLLHDAPVRDAAFFAETPFEAETTYDYPSAAELRARSRPVMERYGVTIPDIYTLARSFVDDRPLYALSLDLFEPDDRQRLTDQVVRRYGAETFGEAEAAAFVRDHVADRGLTATVSMPWFRDHVQVETARIIDIPVVHEQD